MRAKDRAAFGVSSRRGCRPTTTKRIPDLHPSNVAKENRPHQRGFGRQMVGSVCCGHFRVGFYAIRGP